jgi:hypothetical protein
VSIARSIARRAWKLSTIAGEPDDWTVTTRAPGWRPFKATAQPTARVPLPIGT